MEQSEKIDNTQKTEQVEVKSVARSEVALDFRKKNIKLSKLKIDWRKVRIVFAIIILTAASGGAGSYVTVLLLKNNSDLLNQVTQINKYDVSYDSNIVNIVEKISKSVVNISTKTTVYGWFGQSNVVEGAGTGVIISADGYILTNNHVIEGSDSITVTTHDRKAYEAKLMKTDSDKDLAIVKVDVTGLASATIGDSDDIKVGEEVIAIGNVLGRFTDSVTKGIISGLGRPITTSSTQFYGNVEQLDDLIQTDAAINSGNSGGPLVNMKGEIIGINTAIVGDAQNIGFSVPINHATDLVASIKE